MGESSTPEPAKQVKINKSTKNMHKSRFGSDFFLKLLMNRTDVLFGTEISDWQDNVQMGTYTAIKNWSSFMYAARRIPLDWRANTKSTALGC